jgi:hypothetical protein
VFELETDFVQNRVADDDYVHTHKVAVVVHSVVYDIHKAVVGVDSVEATSEFLVKKNHIKNLNHLIPTHVLIQA